MRIVLRCLSAILGIDHAGTIERAPKTTPLLFGIVLALFFLTNQAASSLHAADLLYVSLNNAIVTYDVSLGDATSIQNSVQTFANTNLNGPRGMAFDSSGNLYVANTLNNTIARFTPGGSGSIFANSNMNEPTGLAFDTSGNLYAANYNNNTIARFTPGGSGSIFANSNMTGPIGLAFDVTGKLYVANSGSDTIARFDSGGSGSVFANTNLSSPRGLAFDTSGNLYAANFTANTISRFTSGGSGSNFASSNLTSPVGLAFDTLGNLYAANPSTNNISKFNSVGIFQFSWSTGAGTSPRYLAMPVPEPSTYILGTIAAVTLAWLARRRKNLAGA